MAGESNADVYASFGVNSAVVGGSTPTEHEQAMLELDVAARDGDDSIELDFNSEDPYGADKDPFADGEEEDEGRTQIRINAEGEQAEVSDEENDASDEQSEDDAEGEQSEDFTPLEDAPSELTKASEQLGQNEEAFQEMVEQAAERGLSEEFITRIQTEYAGEGLTPESYDELAKAGYSKAFVDSYIQGQEALVDSYVKSVMDYAGGEDKFNALYKHLEATNVDAAKSLVAALENRDLSLVKTLVNLAGASRTKAFGKPPARTVTKRGVPAAPVVTKVKGFESQAEMIQAMSDPRYRSNAKFRAEVEHKMQYSNF